MEKILKLGKIEGQRRRGWQRMRWHHRLNGHEFEQSLGDSEGQGSLVWCSPWGHTEADTTEYTEYIELKPNKWKMSAFSMPWEDHLRPD